MNKDFIITYTKTRFSPLSAKEEDINIHDIAHALSLMCRANGHIKHFYSVAQHSINCAIEASARGLSERIQLACLLHDASEAYLSDVTRPIKRNLPQYLVFEEALQSKIFIRFQLNDLTEEEQGHVKNIDDTLLYYEFLELMGEMIFPEEPRLTSSLSFDRVDFEHVERQFINMYKILTCVENSEKNQNKK